MIIRYIDSTILESLKACATRPQTTPKQTSRSPDFRNKHGACNSSSQVRRLIYRPSVSHSTRQLQYLLPPPFLSLAVVLFDEENAGMAD